MAKAIITLSEDDDGRPCAVITFDPPLPPQPESESQSEKDKWLEQIPTIQLSGFVIMDQIMDMFGDDSLEITTTEEVSGNGSLH